MPFFYWIAFFYIGIRAKQKKWIVWACVYLIPFITGFVIDTSASGPLSGIWVLSMLGLQIASIVHAFKVRNEYLVHLEALQHRKAASEAALRAALASQYTSGSVPDVHRQPSSPAQTTNKQTTEQPQLTESVTPSPPPEPPSTSAPFRPTNGAVSAPPVSPTTTSTPPASRKVDTMQQTVANHEVVRKTNTLERSEHNITPGIARPREDKTTIQPIRSHMRDGYPFPIAYAFRLLESIVNPTDLYREQLRVAENMLAFLASVSLSLLHTHDPAITGIEPKAYWRSGISPGDWKDIVARCSKMFATYKDHPLASAIQRLHIGSEKKGFGADIAFLIQKKNDFKHDRGPVTEEDIIQHSNEVQAALMRCMEATAFFADYPIRQVLDINVSRRGDKVHLKCLRYTGDHPGLPQEEVVLNTALHKSDLYIDLGDQNWVSLYPYITVRNCPRCKAREIYFIDGWDSRKSVAYMKSFERGHPEEAKEVAAALAEWQGEEGQNES
jgi:hypothetical protein